MVNACMHMLYLSLMPHFAPFHMKFLGNVLLINVTKGYFWYLPMKLLQDVALTEWVHMQYTFFNYFMFD